MATLAIVTTSVLAVSTPASAQDEIDRPYLSGDASGPKYIFHGWPAGEMPVEVWETADKETLVFTETLLDHADGSRGNDRSAVGLRRRWFSKDSERTRL